ncbi:hypothetical protein G7K_3235-t1 [Saitoella complicata NRRL Y-17804]|uniref:Uncharacterized protein n=1 Tax=Saitoella complicata (strain BCRC 22490 / CBS 7301 / JCM 7358 / NBRC 10748 / NRRL Y-17804) TaxID=698492 RepID=A0A0E9NHC2_SAICN|nr:hypothetical protein G7K_3235-t1 [Saitoella complicata NRRL Y-17804]
MMVVMAGPFNVEEDTIGYQESGLRDQNILLTFLFVHDTVHTDTVTTRKRKKERKALTTATPQSPSPSLIVLNNVTQNLSGEGNGETELVGLTSLSETLGVNGGTKTDGNTGADDLSVGKTSNTRVVDLGLNGGERVQNVLSTNFEGNSRRRLLGSPGSATTSLDEGVDLVVVRSLEDGEVVQSLDTDGVVDGGVTGTGSVAGDTARLDVVTDLSTSQETIVANNGISLEGRTLEDVNVGATVESGLLVGSEKLSGAGTSLRLEGSKGIDLEALGDVVVELDLGGQEVGGGPALGKGEAVNAVGVLALEVTSDGTFGVLGTLDGEEDTVGGSSLDLEGGTYKSNGDYMGKRAHSRTREREVLGQEVVRQLGEVGEGNGNGLEGHCEFGLLEWVFGFAAALGSSGTLQTAAVTSRMERAGIGGCCSSRVLDHICILCLFPALLARWFVVYDPPRIIPERMEGRQNCSKQIQSSMSTSYYHHLFLYSLNSIAIVP